jgi:hypothetical protein
VSAIDRRNAIARISRPYNKTGMTKTYVNTIQDAAIDMEERDRAQREKEETERGLIRANLKIEKKLRKDKAVKSSLLGNLARLQVG